MADGSRSSFVESSPLGWQRWLLPSVGDVIFLAFLWLLAFTPLSTRLLGDTGIGWHIRTGEQIVTSSSIPRVDSFSSTMLGKPWFAWEWMFDVVVGWLHILAGLNGVILFAAVVIAGVFAWTFNLLMHRGARLPVATTLVLLAASASMIHFQARPHLLSWLLSLVWFSILDESELSAAAAGSRRLRLWVLPLFTLLWVNLHGSWPLGFVLLAIYWLSAGWTWYRSRSDRFEDVLLKLRTAQRIRQLTWVSFACALATSVNPYGWKLHIHIYQYLSDRFLMDHIDEFQSPNFHGVAQRCFAVLLLVALVALAARVREVRPSEALIVLFSVYSGLWAARNIPVSSLLLVLVAGPRLSEAIAHRRGRSSAGVADARTPAGPGFWERTRTLELGLRGHLWPLVAVLLAAWVAFHGGQIGAHKVMAADFDRSRFPVGAIDFIGSDGSHEPVLTPDYWGGYLIYRLYPNVLAVADDRHDLYGEEFFREYLQTMHLAPDWQMFLRKHAVRLVLVPRTSPLANILTQTAGWKIAYHDDVAVLFDNGVLPDTSVICGVQGWSQ